MDSDKIEHPPEFSDYFNSFVNAFELKRSDTPLSTMSENADMVLFDYLNHSFERFNPPMQKSLSWSSTNPMLAYERDCYLSPYACNDYKRISLTARPRSATLPANSSTNYLNVVTMRDYRKYSNNNRDMGRSSSLSSCQSSTPSQLEAIKENSRHNNTRSFSHSSDEELNDIMEGHLRRQHDYRQDTTNADGCDNNDRDGEQELYTIRRLRSNTAPPAISITDEMGEGGQEGGKVYYPFEDENLPFHQRSNRHVNFNYSPQVLEIPDLEETTSTTTDNSEDNNSNNNNNNNNTTITSNHNNNNNNNNSQWQMTELVTDI